MITCDAVVAWNGPAVETAAKIAVSSGLLELAKAVRNKASQSGYSPRKTGYNAASIGIVTSDGGIQGQGAVPASASPAQLAHVRTSTAKVEAGDVAVVTTSGYGGYLNYGTRARAPSHYMERALADQYRDMGWQRAMQREMKRITALRAAYETFSGGAMSGR